MINYTIYIIAIGSAVIVALLLRLPLLPERPMRQSWTISAIFPTAVLALGFMATVSKLGYLNSSYQDYLVALAVGVLTAIFSKFVLEKILPRPVKEEPPEKSPDKSQEESHG